jgi:hypothetical protein
MIGDRGGEVVWQGAFLRGIVQMKLRKDFIKISIFVKSLMASQADL